MPDRWLASFGTFAVVLFVLVACSVEAEQPTWVASWGVSPQDAENDAQRVSGATIRQFVRISLGGSKARIRISNVHGIEPVLVGSTTSPCVAMETASSRSRTER